jgi:pimeloyl-ACP methyl ester carboxylesterase
MTEQPASRVKSRDGSEIAYWTTGDGPPLVVLHGTSADHTRWRPLLPYLEPHFTVHAIDRRGRGASGDSPHYALEREFEDVAAVVDAVADESGAPVNMYSHGGIVAGRPSSSAAAAWGYCPLGSAPGCGARNSSMARAA